MDLQFVFGNPTCAGKKKPLHNKKHSVKLTKAKKQRSTKMVAKKRKPVKRRKAHGRKNPTVYSVQTGKNKSGDAIFSQVGLPIPKTSELGEIKRLVDSLVKPKKGERPLTKAEKKKAIDSALYMGVIDENKHKLLGDALKEGDLNNENFAAAMKETVSTARMTQLKRYYNDIVKHGPAMKSRMLNASRSGVELSSDDYGEDYINDKEFDKARKGMPTSFYGALKNYYKGKGSSVTKKHKKRRNPSADFGGLEDDIRQNSRKKGKKKVVKAKKHRKAGRPKGSKTKHRTTALAHHKKATTHKKRKSGAKKHIWFTSLAKPRKPVKGAWRKTLKMAAKTKKGHITKYKGYKVRRNPEGIAMVIPGYHGIRPLAMLAGAAAFTGVLNGFVRFGLTKVPALQKITAIPAVAVVMPAVGPLAFAAMLAAVGRTNFGRKYSNTLNEISIALVTVSAVTLGVNALGGLVTNAMRKVFPSALAGYDGSLGLIPEGMAADVDMGDEFGGADFGDMEGDMDGVANFSGADFGDGDFGGVANFSGDMDGVANFAGDNIGDDFGDEMGDADFGDADFGDVDGDMDGVANFSGPSLG